MKMLRNISFSLMGLIFALNFTQVNAQDINNQTDSVLLNRIKALEDKAHYIKPGEDHFMVAGLVTFGFVNNKNINSYGGINTVTQTNSIGDIDHYEFSPMFLWRHGNKLLLEFEPSFSAGGLGVNWANISYFLAPGIILRGGYMVLPFGAYNKKLAAGWINKLASDPENVTGFTDYGVGVEGGFQTGAMKWNYDVTLSNGLALQPDGTLGNAGIVDQNKNKTFTGRIGWLPISNSSLELGASIMTGKVGSLANDNENLRANLYAMDMNLVENISDFQLNVKGQYSLTRIDKTNYINPADITKSYTFDNKTETHYMMVAIRPMFSSNAEFKKFELATRFGNYTAPIHSLIGTKDHSIAFGLNYWLNWRTVVKFSYETIKSENTSELAIGGTPGAINKSHSLYLQFAVQL